MTLDQLVREYLRTKGDVGLNRYELFYIHGVNALRELAIDFVSTPKSVSLPINDNDTVDLPCDYVNYISVSAIGFDGFLHGLGKNTAINITQYYDKCGKQVRKIPPLNTLGALGSQFPYMTNMTYIANHWRNGENTGGYFNAGGHNTVGGYRFNMDTNQIFLSALRQGVECIVLMYISDLSDESGDFIVHPFIVETVKRWIAWQLIIDDRNFSIGEKQVAAQNYSLSRKVSMRRYRNSTSEEWLQAIRRGNSGVPQF